MSFTEAKLEQAVLELIQQKGFNNLKNEELERHN